MTQPTVIPYMCIRDAAQAIDFYKQAFGAKEVMRQADPGGKIRHAEIEIGNSKIMLHDEFPDRPDMPSVQGLGRSAVNIFVYIDGVDAVAERALAAGAKLKAPVEDKPYGRSGGLEDPFGLVWWICTPPPE